MPNGSGPPTDQPGTSGSQGDRSGEEHEAGAREPHAAVGVSRAEFFGLSDALTTAISSFDRRLAALSHSQGVPSASNSASFEALAGSGAAGASPQPLDRLSFTSAPAAPPAAAAAAPTSDGVEVPFDHLEGAGERLYPRDYFQIKGHQLAELPRKASDLLSDNRDKIEARYSYTAASAGEDVTFYLEALEDLTDNELTALSPAQLRALFSRIRTHIQDHLLWVLGSRLNQLQHSRELRPSFEALAFPQQRTYSFTAEDRELNRQVGLERTRYALRSLFNPTAPPKPNPNPNPDSGGGRGALGAGRGRARDGGDGEGGGGQSQ